MTHRYAPKYRPASEFTVPKGWRFVASGDRDPVPLRTDLPRSTHPFGVVEYDRALTPDEIEKWELIEIKEEA